MMFVHLFEVFDRRGRFLRHVNPDTNANYQEDLNSLQENDVVVELGYGGDATRRPQIWVDKLRNQGFHVVMFRFDVSLEVLRRRRKVARPDWKDKDVVQGWKRYQTNRDVLNFANVLGLPETVIETSTLDADEILAKILQKIF